MVSVPFTVVPSAVNTPLPVFRQVLEAAGECLFRYGCEPFSRRRPFGVFSVVGTEKTARREVRGVQGMLKHSNIVFSEKSVDT
jgi:hypothetical protein